MELMQAIRSYENQPITHQILMDSLSGYKRPNDKVYELLKNGILQSIKRGIYLAGPALGVNQPEPFLLANHLLGPSYVSLDAALSYHGLIPEQVFEVSSVTTKASRKFSTPLSTYTYTRLPTPYYSFGIAYVSFGHQQNAMVASAEKALCDKIITTAGMVLRSSVNAYNYLIDDLRMDQERLKAFDLDKMQNWLIDAPKKESLLMVIKMIKAL